jgi:hypothetical protein
MKISPLASGTGSPGQVSGSVEVGKSASSQKLAAAKAIMTGETPIRVSQSDTPTDPQVSRIQERRLKMSTNATPGRHEVPIEVEQSAIPDTIVEAQATTEDTKPLSPQFAALAKQRRALQQERAQFEKEKASAQPTQDGSSDLLARIKSEPLSVLREQGVLDDDRFYNAMTEHILSNQGISPEIQNLKAEIKALKEGVDKTFIDKEAQQKQAVLSEMRKEAVLLAREGDAYELIRETQSIPDVISLIDRTHATSGEVLDVSDAMELVENELLKESLKIANMKKVQSKREPAYATQQQQNQPRQMKTLQNRDASPTTLDRKTRAIMAMNGTLKK